MAELGQFLLILSLAASIYGLVASLLGGRKNSPQLIVSSRYTCFVLFGFLSLASLVLIYGFFSFDFSLKYVASHSSRDMSPVFRLAAFWAGNEGSLLLWSWFLSLFLLFLRPDKIKELTPYIWGIAMGVEAFFLILMIFTASPFERFPFPPPDGQGINPLLENPGMFFHPLTLLSGYAGFTIPFAFALSALVTGKVGGVWVREVRSWTLIAWVLLTLGNLLGMNWAYVVLGWGGYWGWDPVENASLMPWLTGTAFLHSIMIQQRREMLKVWNMVLIIITFHLTILGTFITRSGILSSVHTFGISALGPFLVAFLALSLSISLYFLILRRKELKSEEGLDHWLSREGFFLLNNVVLVAITFAVLLGTFFPFIAEAVSGVQRAVGPGYYEPVVGPLFLLFILLMGLCPLLGWKRATKKNLMRNFSYPLLGALSLVPVLYLAGVRVWYALLAFPVLGLAVGTIFLEWVRGARARHLIHKENYLMALLRLVLSNRPRYGGYITHLGVVLLAIGVLGSKAFDTVAEKQLSPGQEITINNYTLKYEDLTFSRGSRRFEVQATLSAYNQGRSVGKLKPEIKFYGNYPDFPVRDVAIKSNLKEDLYVILMSWDENEQAIFRVHINPLVSWIWWGGGVMVLGTIVALYPPRRRK